MGEEMSVREERDHSQERIQVEALSLVHIVHVEVSCWLNILCVHVHVHISICTCVSVCMPYLLHI